MRKNELLIAESKQREAEDELDQDNDETTREVWIAYIAFRTALRKHDAAVALLESANESYSASLDAYKYGVKNLVDVVTAEKQLALARLSSVSARSELFLEAVNLEFATGNLLRNQPPATRLQSEDGHHDTEGAVQGRLKIAPWEHSREGVAFQEKTIGFPDTRVLLRD